MGPLLRKTAGRFLGESRTERQRITRLTRFSVFTEERTGIESKGNIQSERARQMVKRDTAEQRGRPTWAQAQRPRLERAFKR